MAEQSLQSSTVRSIGSAAIRHSDVNALQRVRQTMAEVRFCCYSPSVFDPLAGQKVPATEECIEQDLAVLRPYCGGLITYGLKDGLDLVIDVAARMSPAFSAVIVGIWDIDDPYEIDLAVRAVTTHPEIVVAVCCGNEGIFFGRYNRECLVGAVDSLRRLMPNVCITSSEPLIEPLAYPLLDCPVEFHCPTIHPWFLPQKAQGPGSADWVIRQIDTLAGLSGLPVLCKETGWPSGGAPEATPEAQKEFWRRLLNQANSTTETAYALFEAYDAGPWKVTTNAASVEEHWGLFYSPSRVPKPVVDVLPRRYMV